MKRTTDCETLGKLRDEKELDDLRIEANDHRQFLDKLRRDPDFQDAVARKELGYGKNEERLYRFPSKDIID